MGLFRVTLSENRPTVTSVSQNRQKARVDGPSRRGATLPADLSPDAIFCGSQSGNLRTQCRFDFGSAPRAAAACPPRRVLGKL